MRKSTLLVLLLALAPLALAQVPTSSDPGQGNTTTITEADLIPELNGVDGETAKAVVSLVKAGAYPVEANGRIAIPSRAATSGDIAVMAVNLFATDFVGHFPMGAGFALEYLKQIDATLESAPTTMAELRSAVASILTALGMDWKVTLPALANTQSIPTGQQLTVGDVAAFLAAVQNEL